MPPGKPGEYVAPVGGDALEVLAHRRVISAGHEESGHRVRQSSDVAVVSTVEDVRLELGVGWGTVMRAVRHYGRPLIDDPDRLAGVLGLGVDETAFLRGTAVRSTQFVTGIVALTPGRPAKLLDIVPGRSGRVYAEWIPQQEKAWRDRIAFAALDPFRGYAAALRTELPDAVRVLDAFHVVRLGFQALDEVRRRVQQETFGHRGHRNDPLYGVRRALRRGRETLTDRAWTRIEAALAAGDPDGEVAAAWCCAQTLREVYHADTNDEGRRIGDQAIAMMLTCPVPEVARLGRTLRSWRTEFLAYVDTDRANNGPTEAMNLLIEKIRRIGHGFRNFNNLPAATTSLLRHRLAHCTHAADQKAPSTHGGVESVNATLARLVD